MFLSSSFDAIFMLEIDLSLENELPQLQPKQTQYILRLALTVL